MAQNAGYRGQIQYLAGEVLALAGDDTGAIGRWRAATAEAPSTEYAYSALVRLVEHQVDFDLYQRGLINLAAESWQPAVNAFTAFLESAPQMRVDVTPLCICWGKPISGWVIWPRPQCPLTG